MNDLIHHRFMESSQEVSHISFSSANYIANYVTLAVWNLN